MTHAEFFDLLRTIFPNGGWDETEDGEMVVYTGMYCTDGVIE